MSTEANKAIIRRYIEQLNRRNEAVIDELVAEDFTADTLHAIPVDASGPSGTTSSDRGIGATPPPFPTTRSPSST